MKLPPASLGKGSSHNQKADNTTREATSKAPATSSDKVKNKAKPSRQSSSRSPRASSHGSSEDKSTNVFQDIFSDTTGDDVSNYQANFDIAVELKACNNSFGAIDEDLLAAASDPVALYAASSIIARNSEAVHDAPPIPTVAPSFKAQDMIFEADRYAVGFLVKQMKTKLLYTPLSNIHALDPELKELFGYITSKNIDVASLREHVEAYVSHARSFHALESSKNRLTDVESHLSDAVNLKRKEEEQIKSQQAEILKIQQRTNELKKELKLLEKRSLNFPPRQPLLRILLPNMTRLDIVIAKDSTTKRKEAEENFLNVRASLESLQWEP
ncbi:DNA repair protein RAD50 [Bienertia sinuspersici]